MLHALNTYNVQIFATAMAVGVWILRKRRAAEGLPPSPFQVPNWILFVWITQCVFLLVMPWSVHFIFPQEAVCLYQNEMTVFLATGYLRSMVAETFPSGMRRIVSWDSAFSA